MSRGSLADELRWQIAGIERDLGLKITTRNGIVYVDGKRFFDATQARGKALDAALYAYIGGLADGFQLGSGR